MQHFPFQVGQLVLCTSKPSSICFWHENGELVSPGENDLVLLLSIEKANAEIFYVDVLFGGNVYKSADFAYQWWRDFHSL